MKNKIVREWLSKAEQDRTTSRTLIRHKKLDVYDVICFHCQQCLEKYLKAYLTSVNVPFTKTHDLMELLDTAVRTEGVFELIRDLIKPLSKFAVRFRYPGEEARRPQAKHAINVMEKARAFIRERIRRI